MGFSSLKNNTNSLYLILIELSTQSQKQKNISQKLQENTNIKINGIRKKFNKTKKSTIINQIEKSQNHADFKKMEYLSVKQSHFEKKRRKDHNTRVKSAKKRNNKK